MHHSKIDRRMVRVLIKLVDMRVRGPQRIGDVLVRTAEHEIKLDPLTDEIEHRVAGIN